MRPPNQLPPEEWEAAIRQRARAFSYPPTPDVAQRVGYRLAMARTQEPTRSLAPLWVTSMILALLIGMWAVPPVRAVILEFLQIGAVRIWLAESTQTPLPTSLSTPLPSSQPTSTPPNSLFNLTGATTLADAEAKVGFPIRLPTYPSDLGPPDGVFYQELDGPAVVLVWMNPQEPNRAAYSLQILSSGAIVNKMNPSIVMTTTVKGEQAVWTEGPYLLSYGEVGAPTWEFRYLVSGRVLIWVEDGLTYRLESNLNLDSAIRMAESLQ